MKTREQIIKELDDIWVFLNKIMPSKEATKCCYAEMIMLNIGYIKALEWVLTNEDQTTDESTNKGTQKDD